MANQPQQLELPAPRTYSRTEFTALRARVKGLSIATITRAYFDSETTEPLDVKRLLRTMRDPALYMNGLCESSHGLGDAGSFSLLSYRARDIVASLEQAQLQLAH